MKKMVKIINKKKWNNYEAIFVSAHMASNLNKMVSKNGENVTIFKSHFIPATMDNQSVLKILQEQDKNQH